MLGQGFEREHRLDVGPEARQLPDCEADEAAEYPAEPVVIERAVSAEPVQPRIPKPAGAHPELATQLVPVQQRKTGMRTVTEEREEVIELQRADARQL